MEPFEQVDDVVLPWRPFKAYVQLWDYFMAEQAGLKLSRRANRAELMVASDTRAGERTRAILLKHELIAFVPPTPESESEKPPYLCSDGMVMVARGTPCGREWMIGDEFSSPTVYPQPRSEAGKAWIRTRGRCAYCGKPLTFFHDLALSKQIDEEYGVRFLACRRCHCSRGTRSLEEYRRVVQMNDFEKRHGVRFNKRQVEFLRKEFGVDFGFREIRFWFEQYAPGEEIPEGNESADPFSEAHERAPAPLF